MQRRVVDARVQADVVDAQADRIVKRSAAWFVAVGCTAAAVHWGIVVALVGQAHWPPLAANVAGWAVAFVVSFAGHHHLSFAGHAQHVAVAARRFFAVSAGGFAINEAAYALLLHGGRWRYDLVLAAVLLGVAGLTYLLGRHWAFLRTAAR